MLTRRGAIALAGPAALAASAVTADSYERSDWPGGARLAVSISLMFESGGQEAEVHGGPLSTIPMAAGHRDLPTETYFEYGVREGIPRLLDVFDKTGVKVTSFVIGKAAERRPDVLRLIAQGGHECAAHGATWVPQYAMPREEERRFIASGAKIIEDITGRRPIGYNCQALRRSENTLSILTELGFRYHIDDVSADVPFVTTVEGRALAVVPYTLHLNDLVQYELHHWTPDMYESALRAEFSALYEEAASTRRMMVISCHDRIAGRPMRARALERFIRWAQTHDRVWFPTKAELAAIVLHEAQPA